MLLRAGDGVMALRMAQADHGGSCHKSAMPL